MRDAEGAKLKNSHLLYDIRRCLKLLFLAVNPVIIFYGETTLLKLQNLAKWQAARKKHAANFLRLDEKLLLHILNQYFLKHSILLHVINATAKVITSKNVEKKSIIDDFYMPIQINYDHNGEQ